MTHNTVRRQTSCLFYLTKIIWRESCNKKKKLFHLWRELLEFINWITWQNYPLQRNLQRVIFNVTPVKKLATLTCSSEWRRIVHRAIKYWHSGMFCYHLVLMNHSWGKSKALRKMVHHFFGHNWQYFWAFQTCKRYWKSFHMTILKKIKFKWSTLGRCSQDEIFPVAIIRILRGKNQTTAEWWRKQI